MVTGLPGWLPHPTDRQVIRNITTGRVWQRQIGSLSLVAPARATTLEEAADAVDAAAKPMLAGDLTAFEAIGSEANDITDPGPTGVIHAGREAVIEAFTRESSMGFRGTLPTLSGPPRSTATHGRTTARSSNIPGTLSHSEAPQPPCGATNNRAELPMETGRALG